MIPASPQAQERRDWSQPSLLTREPPRKVAMTGLWVGMMWLISILFGLPVIVFAAAILGEEHELKTLETRGVDISGTVVRLQPAVTGRGRGDHVPLVGYSYEPKELAGKPDRVIHGERGAAPSEYRTLRPGGMIPLVYDPKHPEQAELKSRVEAHRLGKETPAFPRGLLLFAVIPAGILSYMFWNHLQEKRLLRWGKAARATIIGEVGYQARGKWSRIIFTFQDESGNTVRGEKAGLARGDDPRPDFVQHRQSFLANPTVVYDPRNSARNMLYPGSAAKLVP